MKSRVRLPGDIISRLRLHQHPESLRMKFVRHGIHQVCPGVVNSLGTPRSGNRPTPGQGPAWTGSRFKDSEPAWRDRRWCLQRRWGKRVKCRMKCFYETRSLRSTGSRFWCYLNLEIISPGSRTRDFTVICRYNYRYAVNAFIKSDERLHQNLDPVDRRLRVS